MSRFAKESSLLSHPTQAIEARTAPPKSCLDRGEQRSNTLPARKVIPRRWMAYVPAAALHMSRHRPLPERKASWPPPARRKLYRKKYSLLSQTMDNARPIACNKPSPPITIRTMTRPWPYSKASIDLTPRTKTPCSIPALFTFGRRRLPRRKALGRFQGAYGRWNLMSNPGAFLEAVTLLQRDAPGDRKMAKELLNKVVTATIGWSG